MARFIFFAIIFATASFWPPQKSAVSLKMMLAFFALYALSSTQQSLYEELYKHGYHSDTRITHAKGVLKFVGTAKSVLDLGCSHGFAVAALWKRKIQANGVDIAQTAIDLAKKTRGDGRCGTDPCFQQADATSLPFPDKHFDTLISTDVLEHLSPSDVDVAIREMIRVTRREMWLKVCTHEEANRNALGKLHTNNIHTNVHKLHTAIMDVNAWATRFRAAGSNVTVSEGGLLHVCAQMHKMCK